MTSGNEWIKLRFEQLRLLSKCVDCGSNEDIQFAHINPTKLNGMGRGRNARYYDIIKHPEDYRPKCKECHRKFDNEKAN